VSSVDIIVTGEYEIFFYDKDTNKKLLEFLRAKELYGGISILLNKRKSIRTVIAKKGTIVYSIPKGVFKTLADSNSGFSHFFTSSFGHKMLNEAYAFHLKPKNNNTADYFEIDRLFSGNVGSIEPKKMLTCRSDTTIYRAAQKMTDHSLSYIFIQDEDGNYLGYITDITLRAVVLAQKIATDLEVSSIMEAPIISVTEDTPIYEAIFLMFRERLRYLVVERAGNYIGVLSRNRLMTNKSLSPFTFVQSIKSAQSIEELKAKWKEVPGMVYQLLERGVRAEIVNQVITSVSDSIAVNVIETVLAEKGEPPAKFAFIALGSEGRKEQTLKTDQDNGIVYEDTYNNSRENVRAYFLDFAALVSEYLDYIGFSFCKGGFMAKNPKWCHSLSHWKENYTTWINNPTIESVNFLATFFDSRIIYGDEGLIFNLRDSVAADLEQASSRFYFNLTENALKFEVPLSIFNNFKTTKQDGKEVINIKRAMTPVVDLVRIYALKHKIFTTNNTGERLAHLYEQDLFRKGEYFELLQAYYYMMALRLKRQAKTIIRQQGEPDNFIEPKKLTKIEQVTLKEVFKVVNDFQLKIKIEFKRTIV
jgi:CBS domain-containing protein